MSATDVVRRQPIRGRAALCLLLLAAVTPAPAAAGEALFVGVADDGLKWRPAEAVAVARDLGITSFRLTLDWNPTQTEVSRRDAVVLDRVVASAMGMRVVVAVYGIAVEAPVDDAVRDRYCSYVRSVLARYPTINDVVIWNEPNLSYFWQPQFGADGRSVAPHAYAALLAHCWDVLHAFRPGVNVITSTAPRGNDRPRATRNISHSPANFIRRMGEAYRASGRAQPIFDTVGHHVYAHSSERPWKRHPGSSHIGQGDWDALMNALRRAFSGSAQPLPGDCVSTAERCVSIWYLEAGYQTIPDEAKAALYTGFENDGHPLPDYAGGESDRAPRADRTPAPDQATQILDGIRLAYCQPYVGAFFNFLLWDESDRGRWQSGILWVDGTPKDSYAAFQRAAAEVNAGRVDCARVRRSQRTAGARAGSRP